MLHRKGAYGRAAGLSDGLGQRFSANALRAPLTDDVLARMDQRRTVQIREASCRVVRTKASWRQIGAYLAVSIRFDGEMSNGEHVQAELENVLLSATIKLENHEWRLSALVPIVR